VNSNKKGSVMRDIPITTMLKVSEELFRRFEKMADTVTHPREREAWGRLLWGWQAIGATLHAVAHTSPEFTVHLRDGPTGKPGVLIKDDGSTERLPPFHEEPS
jgi:hypothetical protein